MPSIFWQSIETGGTGRGIPDSYGCCDGKMFWVEFKVTAGFAVTLSPEQVGWHMHHSRKGGRSFIAVRRQCTAGPRRSAVDELYLFHGKQAIDLKVLGLYECRHVAMWHSGPARWDWDQIEKILLQA